MVIINIHIYSIYLLWKKFLGRTPILFSLIIFWFHPRMCSIHKDEPQHWGPCLVICPLLSVAPDWSCLGTGSAYAASFYFDPNLDMSSISAMMTAAKYTLIPGTVMILATLPLSTTFVYNWSSTATAISQRYDILSIMPERMNLSEWGMRGEAVWIYAIPPFSNMSKVSNTTLYLASKAYIRSLSIVISLPMDFTYLVNDRKSYDSP